MRRWVKNVDHFLFPANLGFLRTLAVVYVVFNTLVRVGLAIYAGHASLFWPTQFLPAMLIGFAFDVGTATFFLAPLALLLSVIPNGRFARGLVVALALPLCVVLVFVGFAEFVFWNEFSSRFNFIAVDYLIYTNEVIGNIRESYNMPVLLSGVAIIALAIWAWIIRRLQGVKPHASISPRARIAAAICWAVMPVFALAALNADYKEFSSNAQVSEIAGNGYFDFWHAFWNNEIDYDRYYKTLPKAKALKELAVELNGDRPEVTITQRPYEREIRATGPEKKLNVVLISVESLSAEFLGAFGNTKHLTPNLDRLAQQSLLFTHLYATGTRTVRGLEALTLSIPPTPGHSIVKRPNNDHLFTLGEVFKTKGYEPLYLYGGYGYFDNMNTFFSGNGYTVVDRTALKPEDIHFENIWGVADEDLFTLTLRELDQRHARHTPFFAHVMTTSNHRPFTYPAGRIDIPSKTGRDGGVKYTDWAIGHFIEEARRHPWFDDTVFVIVADHTHKGRGQTELALDAYHIPMLVYSPKHVAPGTVDSIASQIDVGPTVLGLLNFSYSSKFFGQDILREGKEHQRAMMANYQTVGYYEDGVMVELKPNARTRIVDAISGSDRPRDALGQHLLDEAISYYQLASEAFRHGDLRVAKP
ncbi:MAG TPA: LTA synthase family protein [Burkholderiaceae bacterium]|nr:LTA synthase family protein [Burkholderiaceae bacterium]